MDLADYIREHRTLVIVVAAAVALVVLAVPVALAVKARRAPAVDLSTPAPMTEEDQASAPEEIPGHAGADMSATAEAAAGRDASAAATGPANRRGESFYVIVLSTEKDEAAAASRVERSNAAYEAKWQTGGPFVLERSAHFTGLEPGKWIVMSNEAFENDYDAYEYLSTDLEGLGGKDAYVVRVTKNCSDPSVSIVR